MISCEPRMSEYARALRQCIHPGAHVIDLGTGPGILALLACKAGASRVTAIDPHPSIEVARRAARDNGFADKIAFFCGLSTHLFPDTLADVIVSDIRGVLPLFERHIPVINDARTRLLKPGGTMIPAADRVYAALVEAADLYDQSRRPWLENAYGLDLSAGYVHITNQWMRTSRNASALMSKPHLFAALDYREALDPNQRASILFEASRSGTVHGLLLWFDTQLAPGIGFSNAPGEPELVYGQAFFPFEHPVTIAEGGLAACDISANFVDGDYIWAWSIRAEDIDGNPHAYRQSSLKSTIFSPEILAPRAQSFKPPSSRLQDVDAACIGLFNGERTLQEIAQLLLARFPEYFHDENAAFERAASLSGHYNNPYTS